jgi:hypothetical protein
MTHNSKGLRGAPLIRGKTSEKFLKSFYFDFYQYAIIIIGKASPQLSGEKYRTKLACLVQILENFMAKKVLFGKKKIAHCYAHC